MRQSVELVVFLLKILCFTWGKQNMAKYDKTLKYWLQLRSDWFDDDAIKWLEEQPNGEKYSLFYIKLCCKATHTNGYLIRKVGDLLIPYEPQTLAELTRTDIDTVTVAMSLLTKIGLVKILTDGAIFVEQVQRMIGCKTEGALRKELQRDRQKEIGWTMGGQMSTITKNKLVNNNIYNLEYKATTGRVSERPNEERQPLIEFYAEFFQCNSTEWQLIGYEIVDTILEAYEQAWAKGLTFNQKVYHANEFMRLITRIDSEKFSSIATQIKFNDHIGNRPYYILGCIVRSGEMSNGVNDQTAIEQLASTLNANVLQKWENLDEND